ncbi:hypothetical protein JKP88DRAFT_330567 [Tribonema minus]|uniref:Uncharacterized protein n=1 Tax=Tribonema minus TaxID=303371 RepID=A0A836CBK1_9STRA|nr:hypothetical protein JKP88DRAFT_330567 [Tribonema minus]
MGPKARTGKALPKPSQQNLLLSLILRAVLLLALLEPKFGITRSISSNVRPDRSAAATVAVKGKRISQDGLPKRYKKLYLTAKPRPEGKFILGDVTDQELKAFWKGKLIAFRIGSVVLSAFDDTTTNFLLTEAKYRTPCSTKTVVNWFVVKEQLEESEHPPNLEGGSEEEEEEEDDEEDDDEEEEDVRHGKKQRSTKSSKQRKSAKTSAHASPQGGPKSSIPKGKARDKQGRTQPVTKGDLADFEERLMDAIAGLR